MNQNNFSTGSLHGGGKASGYSRNPGKAPSIVQTSVFRFDDIDGSQAYLSGEPDLYMYTRLGNPNQTDLEKRIASLENAQESAVSSSGMSSIFCAALAAGELLDTRRILASSRMYGGTRSLLYRELEGLGYEIREFDVFDLHTLESALEAGPAVILCETISNPSMAAAPVEDISAISRKHSAFFLLDNTFLSPVLFRGLEAGADAVIHSTTKYINGHSDATGGVVSGKSGFIEGVKRRIVNFGCHLNPFEAWLTLRGVQTLSLRMGAHSRNAIIVADQLSTPGKLTPQGLPVDFPLLPGAPGNEGSKKRFPEGCAGMLSFHLPDTESAQEFIRGCDLITFSPSLAGLQTTLSHPVSTSHRGQTEETLRQQGITEGMIRLSVGIEDAPDIIADIKRGLSAVSALKP